MSPTLSPKSDGSLSCALPGEKRAASDFGTGRPDGRGDARGVVCSSMLLLAGEFSRPRDGKETRLASSASCSFGVLGVGNGVGLSDELDLLVRGFTRTVLDRRDIRGEEESRRSGGGAWVVIVGVSIADF